jgi:hypothetical protein
MTLRERFESLHPDIIKSFLTRGDSEAISDDLKRYILLIDKVPELLRRYPSVSRCAKEMAVRYPEYDLAFNTLREIIWDAINYFNLNSTVKNEAWNNYYADKLEMLSNIAIASQNLGVARRCLSDAAKLRQNQNENGIDTSKLRPVIHVLSNKVTAKMLGIRGDYNLKTLWNERRKKYDEAEKFIESLDVNSDEKDRLKNEAALAFNINEAEEADDNQG